MRLRKALKAIAIGRLAASLNRQQAQAALAALAPRPASKPSTSTISSPTQQQSPPQDSQAKDKLRAALSELTPEQAQRLPPSVAAAMLEVLGHKAPAGSGPPSSAPPPSSPGPAATA